MQVAKKEVMGPLCAASMEGSVLRRGYSFLTRLHMLADIEMTARCCLLPRQEVSALGSGSLGAGEEELRTVLNHLNTR